jgi:drug/metabolite transporter (DMT)-like permease
MRLSSGHGRDILYAITVNCIWGLAFVIPEYLRAVDPAVVALGRYFIYGILSAAILLTAARTINFTQIPWGRAFLYAFIGHVGYYVILVWAISMGGIMVVAPIMATLPVTVAMIGNSLSQELAFKRLILPLLFILIGIAFLRFYQNNQATIQGLRVSDMLYGALLALVALSMWTMYAVLNARYLKRIPISSVVWAQAMGLCCLLQVGIAFSLWFFVHPRSVQLLQWTDNYETVIRFLAGIVILGALVSWLSTQVWNKVSRRLPITVAGQLLVVQSLAAILYSSWLDRKIPELIELICVGLVVVGVVWGVKIAYEPRERGALDDMR